MKHSWTEPRPAKTESTRSSTSTTAKASNREVMWPCLWLTNSSLWNTTYQQNRLMSKIRITFLPASRNQIRGFRKRRPKTLLRNLRSPSRFYLWKISPPNNHLSFPEKILTTILSSLKTVYWTKSPQLWVNRFCKLSLLRCYRNFQLLLCLISKLPYLLFLWTQPQKERSGYLKKQSKTLISWTSSCSQSLT